MSASMRSPTVRKSFVSRARALVDDRSFNNALEQEQAVWNARYPEYAIGREVPDDPPFGVGQRCKWPAKLAASKPASVTAREHRQTAILMWRSTISRLCAEWWPVGDFPSWIHPMFGHPCELFVSGALVWGTRWADPEWVTWGMAGLEIHKCDPTDPDQNPDVIFWRTLWEGSARRVSEHLDRGVTLTQNLLDDIAGQAAEEAGQAASQRLSAAQGPGVAFLRLWPRMSKEDAHTLIDEALDELNYRDVEQSETTYDTVSDRALARKLGISRATVASRRGKPRKSGPSTTG